MTSFRRGHPRKRAVTRASHSNDVLSDEHRLPPLRERTMGSASPTGERAQEPVDKIGSGHPEPSSPLPATPAQKATGDDRWSQHLGVWGSIATSWHVPKAVAMTVAAALAACTAFVTVVQVLDAWDSLGAGGNATKTEPTDPGKRASEVGITTPADLETALLGKLHPGGSFQKLTSLLGQPDGVRRSGGNRRSTWVRELDAVLAVHDKDGRVLLLAITSLDKSFRPALAVPGFDKRVTLWTDTVDSAPSKPVAVCGFAGVNRFSYFEQQSAWRGSNFQEVALGLNDAATGAESDFPLLFRLGMDLYRARLESCTFPHSRSRTFLRLPDVPAMRAQVHINTVAWTAPAVSLADVGQFPGAEQAEVLAAR
jgi:hypothetical protein